jgi:hypothetical protein
MYKRTSFCGPAGDGFISELLSALIAWSLSKLKVNLEGPCSNHDLNWDDGPDTVDDIRFALDVYVEIRKKSALLAGIMSLIGFILVRLTAIVYKFLEK